MEPRRAPEYTLEVFADPTCVKDVVKAVLHTIFFHRYFMTLTPVSRDLFDTTLPAVDDVELEALIEHRVTSLVRSMQLQSQPSSASSFSPKVGPNAPSSSSSAAAAAAPVAGAENSGRGQLAVSFFERKRRKTYFFGKADEDVCWETWLLNVTCAMPRTDTEKIKVRRAVESSLQKAAFKIIGIVNRDRDHIPPITTTDTNPFPYQISVGNGMGGAGSSGGGGANNGGGGGGSPRIGIY